MSGLVVVGEVGPAGENIGETRDLSERGDTSQECHREKPEDQRQTD